MDIDRLQTGIQVRRCDKALGGGSQVPDCPILVTNRCLGALDKLLFRAFRPVHRPSRAAKPPRRLVAILGRV